MYQIERYLTKAYNREYEAKSLIRSIFSGLSHAHAEGVMHRSISLDTIMFATDPKVAWQLREVRICGFTRGCREFAMGGVEGHLDLRSNSGEFNAFNAPEMSSLERREISPSVDLWSVGVILFAVIQGEFPFDGAVSGFS